MQIWWPAIIRSAKLQKSLLESQSIFVHSLSVNKTAKGDRGLFIQVAPTYWPPARDLLGRSAWPVRSTPYAGLCAKEARSKHVKISSKKKLSRKKLFKKVLNFEA